MLRYEFRASKSEKGLVILGRPFFDRVVASLREGCEYVLTLTEHIDKRSNAQNRMVWGTVYSQIKDGLVRAGHYEPHERDEVKALIHEGLCAKYQGYVTCPVTGQQVRKFRSSKANKQEFSDYVEWVARYAATEYGVVVVLPGEVT